MDHVVLVQVLHRPRDGRHAFRGPPRVERPARQLLGQRAAFDEIHREEMLAVHLSRFVDADDVRMSQAASGAGLGVEAADVVRGSEPARQNHLERDGAIEVGLMGPIDNAHSASADFFEQLVFAERLRSHFRNGGHTFG